MYNVICLGQKNHAAIILVDKIYDINVYLSIIIKYYKYKFIPWGGEENIKIIIDSSFNQNDWDILSKLYNSDIIHYLNHRCIDPNTYWYHEYYDSGKYEKFILDLKQEEVNLLFDIWGKSSFSDNTISMAKEKITTIHNEKIIKDIIE